MASTELQSRVDAAVSAASSVQDSSAAAEALAALLSLQVSTKMLMETQAGKKVKKLASHSDPSIASAAGSVLAAWKEVVKQEQLQTPSPASGSQLQRGSSEAEEDLGQPAKRQKLANGAPGAAAKAALAHIETKSSASESGLLGDASYMSLEGKASGVSSAGLPAKAAARTPSQQPPERPAASAPLHPAKTGDPVRDKARLLLAEALAMAAEEVPDGDPSARAVDVEKAILAQNGTVNPRYKAKLRSLSFNMRDSKNPDLRRRVLAGEISGKQLVEMPTDQLGSDSRKEENDKIRADALRESERGQHMQKATTDQFQCGKCRQRKCTYYQMQTRSADEPMTTFVTCTNCNNRWKFC